MRRGREREEEEREKNREIKRPAKEDTTVGLLYGTVLYPTQAQAQDPTAVQRSRQGREGREGKWFLRFAAAVGTTGVRLQYSTGLAGKGKGKGRGGKGSGGGALPFGSSSSLLHSTASYSSTTNVLTNLLL